MKRSRMHCKDFLPLRVIGKVADDVAATITNLFYSDEIVSSY